MESGYVTSGSAAGMVLAAAACIAGTDPERIKALPESDGLANEFVIHRAHRINYDQMLRVGGGRLVEIGTADHTEPRELEQALTARTAGVFYVDSRHTRPGALDFATVVRVAHDRGVPVIVDAASTVPPVDHLRRWGRWGADLVIFSGGKGLRGPQDSGFLAGRADLIEAARANGNPNASVGRGMKVSKEAMAGLWKAIEVFLETDHEAELSDAPRPGDGARERARACGGSALVDRVRLGRLARAGCPRLAGAGRLLGAEHDPGALMAAICPHRCSRAICSSAHCLPVHIAHRSCSRAGQESFACVTRSFYPLSRGPARDVCG